MLRDSICVGLLGALLAWDVFAATGAEANGSDETPPQANAALQYYQAALELLNYRDSFNIEGVGRFLWIIDHAEEAPLDRWAARIVHGKAGQWAALGHSLSYLHRGAKMGYCEWGVPWEEQGLGACTPHIEQLYPVAKAACLRARLFFEENEDEAAVNDLIAVLALSRHLANEGRDGHQGLSIQGLIEQKAMRIAARHLPEMNADCADRLVATVETLPGKQALENMVRMQERLWIDWHVAYAERATGSGNWDPQWMTNLLHFSAGTEEVNAIEQATGGTPQGLIRLVKRERAYFQKAASLMSLPHDEFETRWAALEEEAEAENAPIATLELGSLSALRRLNDQCRARRGMFKAAAAVVHGGGVHRLEDFKDPFGAGPFTYRALPDGFELLSELKDALQGGPSEAQKPITLAVGPVTQE